jgi:O-antigen/teichoic acid export membrane protein
VSETSLEPTPGPESLSGHAMRGAKWSVITNALAAPLNLAAAGFAVEQLGRDRYGVWAMIAVFANFLRIGDFGLSASFARMVAERLAKGEEKALGRALSSVTTTVLVVAAALVTSAWLGREWLLFDLFRIPQVHAAEAVPAFGLMLLSTLATLLSPTFSSLLIGAQRTDREKQITGATVIVLSAGMIVALALGTGIKGIATAQLFASVAGLIAFVVAARRSVPQIPLRPFCGIDVAETWGLVRFGAGLQLTQLAMQAMTQADRLLISHYIGVGMAGAYDVALKALYTLQAATHHLITPLYAAAARLKAEGKTEEIGRWIQRSGRIFAAVAGPAYGLVCAGAPVIVAAWIGRPDARVAATLALIAAVQATNLGNGPGYFMLLGTGDLRPILFGSVVSAVTGIAFAWGTVTVLGYNGVVAAHALAVITLMIWVSVAIRRVFGTSVLGQLKLSVLPFLVGAAEGGLLRLLAPHLPTTRLLTLLIAALLTVPGFLLLWRLGFLTYEDRQFLMRFLPGSAARRLAERLAPRGPVQNGAGASPAT